MKIISSKVKYQHFVTVFSKTIQHHLFPAIKPNKLYNEARRFYSSFLDQLSHLRGLILNPWGVPTLPSGY